MGMQCPQGPGTTSATQTLTTTRAKQAFMVNHLVRINLSGQTHSMAQGLRHKKHCYQTEYNKGSKVAFQKASKGPSPKQTFLRYVQSLSNPGLLN